MTKADIKLSQGYFNKYIEIAPNLSVAEALTASLAQLKELNVGQLLLIGNKTYQPGKWTINDIFQHLVDVERMFTYRVLLAARKDSTIMFDFDEKYIADNSNAHYRNLIDILEELIAVRHSTILMFKSFDDETMLTRGLNGKHEMPVAAFGYCIIGHQIWHLNIIKEKYLLL
jgi:hypothetical protein